MSTPTRRPLTAFGSLRQRVVGHRQWSDEDRAAIVGSLFPRPAATAEFVLRFLTLMVLSTVIAALGLMSNSAAVVIGAMLVAPLMTPIPGVAFSVMMGNPNRFLGSLALIGAGVVVAIGAAAAVSALAPGTVTADELSGELLARTAPTLLDLGIAVAAGLAAGYVLTHPLASSSLPGVAIAVALVPPLATVGIALQLGATDAAEGAFLLFSTNLLAIVLSAMVVALLSGIASLRGPEAGERGVRSGLVITGAMLVVVAVPLTVHTIEWSRTGTSPAR